MISGIVSRLAWEQRLPFVGLSQVFAPVNRRDMPPVAQSLFLPKGYCYGGITSYPTEFDIPIIEACRSTLIIRDPRDLMVSLYHSMKQSHPEPEEGTSEARRSEFERGRNFANETSIDTFVVNAVQPIHAMYSSYRRIFGLQTLKVFRYEDVIYRKREWVAEICDHFRWSVAKSVRDSLADSYDVFPEKEQRNSHIRQVHPGNFKTQLQDETIRTIEEAFAADMSALGYQPQMTVPVRG